MNPIRVSSLDLQREAHARTWRVIRLVKAAGVRGVELSYAEALACVQELEARAAGMCDPFAFLFENIPINPRFRRTGFAPALAMGLDYMRRQLRLRIARMATVPAPRLP